MIKVSLLGFTTEIKTKIYQLNLPEGGQKNKKKSLKKTIHIVIIEEQMERGVGYLVN